MKFVIALIALFAVSAMAQNYQVVSIYSDSNCSSIVGNFVSVATDACAAQDTCTQFGTSGHYYSSVCNATATPTFPLGWVVVAQGANDTACGTPNYWIAGVPDTCFIFASSEAVGLPAGSYVATELGSCNAAGSSVIVVAGEQGNAAPSCAVPLTTISNATATCTTDSDTGLAYAIVQCQAAAPTAEPTAAPTAQPSTTPTTTTTPSTTTTPHSTNTPHSSAAVLAASGLLSVVALLL